MNSRGQIAHAFVILFGIMLISMTVLIFSTLEARIIEEALPCETLVEEVHSELILSQIYSTRYSSYERTLSIPHYEILLKENQISCGPYSRETNINLGGLGSFREGFHVLGYENGKRI